MSSKVECENNFKMKIQNYVKKKRCEKENTYSLIKHDAYIVYVFKFKHFHTNQVYLSVQFQSVLLMYNISNIKHSNLLQPFFT